VAFTLLAWHLPGLSRLQHPVFWTRDLEHGPEDLAAMFSHVPDGAILLFDPREPLRLRGILATPAFMSFGKTVMVYPDRVMIERAITADTEVYLLSGGWETDDVQRWGPWTTHVVARGVYRAQRAAIVEGAMPETLTEWGGAWEMQRIDPSIWRDSGAFSLHPGSRFLARDTDDQLETVPLELTWERGWFVELLVEPRSLSGCEVTATLHGERTFVLTRTDSPTENRLRFVLPSDVDVPVQASLAVSWACARPRAVRWRRFGLHG
jgi:hypothetical protein